MRFISVLIGLITAYSTFASNCGGWFLAQDLHSHLMTQQESPRGPKERGRKLSNYARQIIGSHLLYEDIGDPMSEFFKQFQYASSKDRRLPLLSFISHIKSSIQGHLIWVDFGGGLGFAQREFKLLFPPFSKEIRFILFDGVDWMANRTPSIKFMLSNADQRLFTKKGAFRKKYELEFVQGNFEKPNLDVRPHLITAVEAVQYSRDKLNTLVNWYNLLADNGYLIAVVDGVLGFEMRNHLNESITISILRKLKSAGIEVYARAYDYDIDGVVVSGIILIKKPNTHIRVNARLINSFTNGKNYEIPSYRITDDNIITVEDTN